MWTKTRAKRLLLVTAAALAVAGGTIAVTSPAALADSTYCKTLDLAGDWQEFAISPHMVVPICYDGTSVWQNGNVTPGVRAIGFFVDGFDWAGTYGSGNWLGAGEDFSATTWQNGYTTYCTPRWGIDAWGNVVSYSRNCY